MWDGPYLGLAVESGAEYIAIVKKKSITPGPWYLIFEDAGVHDPVFQVIGIELVSSELYTSIRPAIDENSYQGFLLFKKHCLKCHSINLIGGTLGPELNTPQNILDYRDESQLRSFILNPQSFRARSSMPAFKEILRKGELESILLYLKWNKGKK